MNQSYAGQTLADAQRLFKEKAYPEALELCKTLRSRKGPQATILSLEALIHKQSGDLEQAGKSIELALTESPADAGILFTAALINRQLKNFELAKRQAMKAVREAPDSPQIVCQCAVILGKIGEAQYALKILEEFVQKNPRQAQAWYWIGNFQADLENNEAAEYALRQCMALEPDHARAQNLLKNLESV
jgi:tetratricopeptide (TPR) repeat protein